MARIINADRFERIPESGRKEHYLDRLTGQEVSRRFATEASTGMRIEERQATIRANLADLGVERQLRSPFKLLEEQLVRNRVPVRGPEATRFRSLKEELRDTEKSDWQQTMYDYFPEGDFWDDFEWREFFGYPE